MMLFYKFFISSFSNGSTVIKIAFKISIIWQAVRYNFQMSTSLSTIVMDKCPYLQWKNNIYFTLTKTITMMNLIEYVICSRYNSSSRLQYELTVIENYHKSRNNRKNVNSCSRLSRESCEFVTRLQFTIIMWRDFCQTYKDFFTLCKTRFKRRRTIQDGILTCNHTQNETRFRCGEWQALRETQYNILCDSNE